MPVAAAGLGSYQVWQWHEVTTAPTCHASGLLPCRVVQQQLLHTHVLPGAWETLTHFASLARLWPGTLFTNLLVVSSCRNRVGAILLAVWWCILCVACAAVNWPCLGLFLHLAGASASPLPAPTPSQTSSFLRPCILTSSLADPHLWRHYIPVCPPGSVRRRQPHHQRAAAAAQVWVPAGACRPHIHKPFRRGPSQQLRPGEEGGGREWWVEGCRADGAGEKQIMHSAARCCLPACVPAAG